MRHPHFVITGANHHNQRPSSPRKTRSRRFSANSAVQDDLEEWAIEKKQKTEKSGTEK
jgi:hypothetical protein